MYEPVGGFDCKYCGTNSAFGPTGGTFSNSSVPASPEWFPSVATAASATTELSSPPRHLAMYYHSSEGECCRGVPGTCRSCWRMRLAT